MPTATSSAAAADGAATAAPAAPRPIVGHIPGFRKRVAECNEITAEDIAGYVPLVVAGVPVGLMQEFFAEELTRHGAGIFARSSDGTSVHMDAEGKMTPEERTEFAAGVMEALRDAGVVGGWRDELFPVSAGYGDSPLMLVERATASLLGIRAYGVHINGFVRLPNGELELWVRYP